MQERYPVGSVIPVEPWLTDGIQKLSQSRLKFERENVGRDMYLVQHFQAWRVFPVRVGRWYRSTEQHAALNDPVSGAWYAMRTVVGAGHWTPRPDIVQVLDPGTGQPIAEHLVRWGIPEVGESRFPGPDTRAAAIIGDPRVCGLFSVLDGAGPPTVAFGRNRQGGNVKWDAQDIEKQTPKLVGRQYQDYAAKEDGPWIIDHPLPPEGGKTRWGRYSGEG